MSRNYYNLSARTVCPCGKGFIYKYIYYYERWDSYVSPQEGNYYAYQICCPNCYKKYRYYEDESIVKNITYDEFVNDKETITKLNELEKKISNIEQLEDERKIKYIKTLDVNKISDWYRKEQTNYRGNKDVEKLSGFANTMERILGYYNHQFSKKELSLVSKFLSNYSSLQNLNNNLDTVDNKISEVLSKNNSKISIKYFKNICLKNLLDTDCYGKYKHRRWNTSSLNNIRESIDCAISIYDDFINKELVNLRNEYTKVNKKYNNRKSEYDKFIKSTCIHLTFKNLSYDDDIDTSSYTDYKIYDTKERVYV